MPGSTLLTIALYATAWTSAPLAPELQPLGYLVGSCWRGSFADGGTTDMHCFTPMLGGRFVRDRHVVEGVPVPYAGESIYRWDSAVAAIRYDYYSSQGAHSAGIAQPAADGLDFPQDDLRTADGSPMALRSRWTRDGPDAYVARSERREGTAWRELWRIRFERVSGAQAAGEDR